MRRIWAAGGIGFLIVIYLLAASREYTLHGSISVILLLLALSIPVLALTRRPVSISVVIGSALVLIDYIDRAKFKELRQHLHHQDFGIVFQFAREMNVGFFQQYAGILMPALFALAIFIVVLVFSWHYEGKVSRPRQPLLSIIAAIAASGSAIVLFMDSGYMLAVKSQLPPRVAADRAPLRISAALASFSESLALSKTLAADQALYPSSKSATSASSCGTCPDIIIIHLESVYDPRLDESYSHMPPFADLIGGTLDKWHASMRVNTWGGNSVVTEFEMLCSVNHELFGWGGFQPHINVAPFLSGCFGSEIKDRGYHNTVLYSLNGSFSNVREAFRRYGISDFRDFTSLGLPRKWNELHDRLIYEHLFAALEKPRTSPRFFWISTNWNHGPHGLGAREAEYVGPYDPALANSPALADYVNRLNDSIAGLNAVVDYVESAQYPVVLVAYGDHHPAFAKDYSQETTGRFDSPDYITPVVMLRNFSGTTLPDAGEIMVEETMYYLSHFAGLSPLQSVERIKRIQERCGGDQTDCSNDDKRELRSIHLVDG